MRMAGYYRRSIQDFAKITSPLTKFSRKGVEYIWIEDCDKAFKKIKMKIIHLKGCRY